MDKRIKKMILAAMFSAMAIILYLAPKFSLPIFPSFLEFNFSMLPIIICGFALGPVYGLVAVALRFGGNLIVEGTTTASVGELMDLMLGSAVVISASCCNQFIKLKEPIKSIITVAVGIVVWILAGSILNAFYAIPNYLKLYFGGNVEGLVGMLKVIPGVNSTNYLPKYILFAVIPFNLMLSSVVFLVTMLVHKRIKLLYEKEEKEDTNDEENA